MEPIVSTTSGMIRGLELAGVLSFKGIPYAAPPFAQNRMRPPSSHPSWEGVRDCVDYGPTVPKGPYAPPFDQILPEPFISGEECLNLNVWTPGTGAMNLPVLIWIHGGSFLNGSGAVSTYDGTNFARDGVVCVTINYRLGADGFLFLDDGISNLGILDQLAALRWVQDNIAFFGGDPHKVTIAGESAGAMSVGTLLSLEAAKGLFRGAIMQSGAAHHYLSSVTAKKVAGYLAEALGIEPVRDEFRAVEVDRLIKVTSDLAAQPQAEPDPAKWGEVTLNLMIFEPTLDGFVIKSPPIESIKSGAGDDVAVLIGTNRQEFNFFTVPTGFYDVITQAVVDFGGMAFGLDADKVAVYQELLANEPQGEIFSQMAGDWFFRIPAIRLAEARQGAKANTYLYEFDWQSQMFDGRLGACHALELPFVFDTVGVLSEGIGLAFVKGPQELAEEMHSSWVAFIKNLDPGWDIYSTDDRVVRIFGGDSRIEVDPGRETREIWDGLR